MDADDNDSFILPTTLNDSQFLVTTDNEQTKSSIDPPPSEVESEKRCELISWLESKCEIINPEFEDNEIVVDTLHNLMRCNKQRDADIASVIGQFNSMKSEYEMEGKRYEKFIQRLGIRPEHLDTDFQTWLDTLAQINLILDLKSPTNTDLLLAVNQLQDTKMVTGNEIATEKKLVSIYREKTQRSLQKSYELKKILMLSKENLEIQEKDILKQIKKMEFLPKKIEEYEEKFKKLKLKLEQMGFRSEIRHEALCKRNKDLVKITNEIKASQVTLDTFSNLPPDLPVIKQKIEVVRKELSKVDAALKAKITNLTNF